MMSLMTGRLPSQPDPAPRFHCALCALPCLPASDVKFSSTTSPSNLDLCQVSFQQNWLQDHTTLRMSTGSDPYPSWAGSPLSPPIQVHNYCLAAGLRLQGSAHGRRMLKAWSLPKWTASKNWEVGSVAGLDSSSMAFGKNVLEDASTQWIGVSQWAIRGDTERRAWKGLKAQQERWRIGKRHYLDYLDLDLISPTNIQPPNPSSSSFDLSIRPRELHCLATLPSHILTQIASYLLDPIAAPKWPGSRLKQSPDSPSSQIPAPHRELQALLNTSSSLRYFDFPNSFWSALIKQSLKEYKHQLLSRWSASPGQAISTDLLEKAFKENFSEPVNAALDSTIAQDGDKKAYTARDVYYWWTFSESWRSRRRVWRCVVYGCAQVRDADWL